MAHAVVIRLQLSCAAWEAHWRDERAKAHWLDEQAEAGASEQAPAQWLRQRAQSLCFRFMCKTRPQQFELGKSACSLGPDA